MRQVSIPVGVIVARHGNRRTAWHETSWRVAMIVAGAPAARAGSVLWAKRGVTLIFAGAADLSLHPSEIGSYRSNLAQAIPLIYAVLTERAGSLELHTVTAAPDEAEAYVDSDGVFVGAAAMPPPIAALVSAYVESCGNPPPSKNGNGPDVRPPASGDVA